MPQLTGAGASFPARPTVGPTATTAAVLGTVLVGLWTVGVTVGCQVTGWLVEQVLLVYGVPRPGWLWPALSLGNAGLVALPAMLLAWSGSRRSPDAVPTVGAVAGRTWLIAAVSTGLLGLSRAVPTDRPELYLGLLALASGGLGWWWGRRPTPVPVPDGGASPSGRSAGLPLAVAAGAVVLLPWWWAGALGGGAETVLSAVAAAGLGWLAASVLRRVLEFRGWVAGPLAAVALLLVAAGAGGSGAHLALLLVLPPVAFPAWALTRLDPDAAGRVRWPVAVLVALTALGPLALVDPEEINLFQATDGDVPLWAAVAAGASVVLALASTWALRWRPTPSRPVAAALAGVAVLASGIVYVGAGQPGLYGERLFVVMADQADLSGVGTATGPAGRDARATEVYRRLVAHAEADQADLRAALDRLRLPYTPYYLVNAIEVTGGPAVRAWLNRRDDVARVLTSQQLRPVPARVVTGSGSPADLDTPEWNIRLLRADRVWQQLGVTGEGIVIGSSDSGVDGGHPALSDGFRGGDDSWHDPWNHTTRPVDHNGHGTHTLGSALGRGGIGVAPGAQWVACVDVDRALGNPARYLDCLQFMLAPYPPGGDPWRDGQPRRAPHVLTNSWGCPPIEGCDLEALRPATAALAAAGIYVVAAAGNAGPFCGSVRDPLAPYPDVLTVGAVDRDRELAPFSSRGDLPRVDKPDVVAPGSRVRSAMPGGGYARLDGTSMAAPHAAGVVALMWSANPDLIGDLATTTRLLRETARPVTVADPDACGGEAAQVGAGLIDAYAAVQRVLR